MLHNLQVGGNYGTLMVHPKSGRVLGYVPEEGEAPDYSDIVKFNMPEFHRQYPNAKTTGNWVDILDIGFWAADAGGVNYCAPEDNYREFNDDPALRPSVILL